MLSSTSSFRLRISKVTFGADSMVSVLGEINSCRIINPLDVSTETRISPFAGSAFLTRYFVISPSRPISSNAVYSCIVDRSGTTVLTKENYHGSHRPVDHREYFDDLWNCCDNDRNSSNWKGKQGVARTESAAATTSPKGLPGVREIL